MADLPAISDSNLYAAKTDADPVPVGEEDTHVSAADMDALRARISENRTQANAGATGDMAGPASATDGAFAVYDGTGGKLVTEFGGLTPANILFPGVTTHATSTKTLSSFESLARFVIDSDTIGGDCTVTITDTITAGFTCELRLDGTGGDLLFAASGTQTITYYGQNTATVAGTVAAVYVESATRCEITIVEPV